MAIVNNAPGVNEHHVKGAASLAPGSFVQYRTGPCLKRSNTPFPPSKHHTVVPVAQPLSGVSHSLS